LGRRSGRWEKVTSIKGFKAHQKANGLIAMSRMDEKSKIVCACFSVSEADIRAHLADPQNTLESLVSRTEIGTKCTACLLDLDLIIDDTVALRRSVASRLGQGMQKTKGLSITADLTSSGFFLNRQNVKTSLRVSNFPVLFESKYHGVPYSVSLRLVSAAGKCVKTYRQDLNLNDTMHVSFSDLLPPHIEDGWFLLSLYPKQRGLVGSIRPQVALEGANWVSTYHTQTQAMATKDGARNKITVYHAKSGFQSCISVINANSRPGKVTVRMHDMYGPWKMEHALDLGASNATIVDLDDLFPQAPVEGVLQVTVTSDIDTRKHILIQQPNGSLSIDHFPN
jgi:bacterioferritin-associated ferredoxin